MFSFCVNVINSPLYRMPAPCAVLMSKPRCSGNGGGRQLHRQVQPQERRKELARSYPSVGKGIPPHTIVHKKVVLTRTVLGSVSTGRYGGNSNNGSPQNPHSPPGQPMSDDHPDHLDDDDHEGYTAYKDFNKKLSRPDQISVLRSAIYV